MGCAPSGGACPAKTAAAASGSPRSRPRSAANRWFRTATRGAGNVAGRAGVNSAVGSRVYVLSNCQPAVIRGSTGAVVVAIPFLPRPRGGAPVRGQSRTRGSGGRRLPGALASGSLGDIPAESHMRATTIFGTAVLAALAVSLPQAAAKVLFEDSFKGGLSMQWQPVGLDKKDYRINDGGLEMRVQTGPLSKDTPLLKVVLPFDTKDTVVASVTVTPLDAFTAEKECAALCLLTDGSPEFSARKQKIGERLVFAPGNYQFKGQRGEEGDVSKYEVKHTDATKDAGPLRVIFRQRYAYFQVGPSTTGEYKTFFESALRAKADERGFGLAAAGAPEKADHWVRFTNFRVEN